MAKKNPDVGEREEAPLLPIPPQSPQPVHRTAQMAAITTWYGRPVLYFDMTLIHGDYPRFGTVSGLSDREGHVGLHVSMHPSFDLQMGSSWNAVECFRDVRVLSPEQLETFDVPSGLQQWAVLYLDVDSGRG